MKSLLEYILEWKEDMGNQVIMIMGTPGCGKTYFLDHNGIKFLKSQGITINPKQLDIDHTLKYFQVIDFPKFCYRVINYKSTTVSNSKGSVHNNKNAWKTFIENEQNRYTELNKSNKGLDTNIPKLADIDYAFVSPWLTRYENASESNKDKVFDEFVHAMFTEYFNKVFASDFSVRGEAKEEYNKNLIQKLDNTTDAFAAISGAKIDVIKEIAQICKNKGMTCRIIFLNGTVEKAIIQDAKRERSGGKDFVIDYSEKIERVWNELINPNSDNYFKKLGIYNMYEMYDLNDDDVNAYPAWKLKKLYK